MEVTKLDGITGVAFQCEIIGPSQAYACEYLAEDAEQQIILAKPHVFLCHRQRQAVLPYFLDIHMIVADVIATGVARDTEYKFNPFISDCLNHSGLFLLIL